MKPLIRYTNRLPSYISGIALFPFIFLRKNNVMFNPFLQPTLINHEKIHFQQQLELGIIPFYILYLVNYVINYVRFGNSFQAYYNISFEQEAYKNQSNFLYLKSRKLWSWIKYLKL